MTPSMQKQIAAIPYDREWHKTSTKETFEDAGEQLLDHGFSEYGAIQFLTKLYMATSDEFGS